MAGGIRVEGVRELQRAFGKIDGGLKSGLALQLTEAAQPAAAKAASYAWSRIRNMDDRWSRMKIGAAPGAVYLAPKARRRGGSPRPNLGPLLLNKSMLPAAEETMPVIRERLDTWLDALGEGAGF